MALGARLGTGKHIMDSLLFMVSGVFAEDD
jgi:hypothetical protein